jgi:hypothetical protein
LTDIEKELKHYKRHFKNKVVFCNCDDPTESNFFVYFELQFKHFGLKKLITTHYDDKAPSYKMEVYLDSLGRITRKKTPLMQSGDFRSDECIALLKEADIVVTNPPFSLFREYIAQLMEHKKKFIVMGSNNALTYKEVFKHIRDNKLWLGANNGGTKWFQVPMHYHVNTASRMKVEDGTKFISLGNISWFTNLNHKKRNEEIILFRKYNAKDYPTYDNYDAIEVSKVADIPMEHKGTMGVPVTFLDKYNPKQFRILGYMATTKVTDYNFGYPYINGKKKYARIIIKRK